MLRFIITSALIISGLSIILPEGFIDDLLKGPAQVVAEAKYDMVNVYRKDGRIDADLQKATMAQIRAADKGDAESQYLVGVMLYKGQGMNKDYPKAAKYIKLSADQGYANAQVALGIMYYKGKGVPKDIVSAYQWTNLAAMQGNEKAIKKREVMLKKMDTKQLIAAQKLIDQ